MSDRSNPVYGYDCPICGARIETEVPDGLDVVGEQRLRDDVYDHLREDHATWRVAIHTAARKIRNVLR